MFVLLPSVFCLWLLDAWWMVFNSVVFIHSLMLHVFKVCFRVWLCDLPFGMVLFAVLLC